MFELTLNCFSPHRSRFLGGSPIGSKAMDQLLQLTRSPFLSYSVSLYHVHVSFKKRSKFIFFSIWFHFVQDPKTRYPVVVRFNKVNYANVSTNNYALDEIEEVKWVIVAFLSLVFIILSFHLHLHLHLQLKLVWSKNMYHIIIFSLWFLVFFSYLCFHHQR